MALKFVVHSGTGVSIKEKVTLKGYILDRVSNQNCTELYRIVQNCTELYRIVPNCTELYRNQPN